MKNNETQMPEEIYVSDEKTNNGTRLCTINPNEFMKKKGVKYTRADLADNWTVLPEIEYFTGHAHTLREDLGTLQAKISEAEAEGRHLMHPAHMIPLMYNLKLAVDYLEKLGVRTFAEDRKDENTARTCKQSLLEYSSHVTETCKENAGNVTDEALKAFAGHLNERGFIRESVDWDGMKKQVDVFGFARGQFGDVSNTGWNKCVDHIKKTLGGE